MTKRQHVLASYAVLAAVAWTVLVVLLGPPVRNRIAFAEELENMRATYVRSAQALERSEALQRSLADRTGDSDVARYLHKASTAALAGADLQNQLHTMIGAVGAVLVSSAFRQGSADGSLEPIVVSVRLRCSVEALLAILHGLEGREPALFVETLIVQSQHRPGRPLRDLNSELDVELDIAGYLDPGAAP